MANKEIGPIPEEVHKVVRVFPFALRTPEDILKDYEDYKDLKGKKRRKLSLTEVYLVQKPQGDGPSAGKIAPIGGGIQGGDDRSTLAEAVAHIQGKTTFSCSPLENTEETREKFEIPGNIKYSLINDRCFHANLVIVPVINPKTLKAISPDPDDKIESFKALTTEELKLAVGKGTHRGTSLVGHITTKQKSRNISLTYEENKERKLFLNNLRKRLKDIEDKNRAKFRKNLLLLAINKGLKVDTFEQERETNGEEEQEISLEQLMLKIEEKCESPGDFKLLFNEAYGSLLSELYMDYFRSREMDTYGKLKEKDLKEENKQEKSNEEDLEERSKPKKPNVYKIRTDIQSLTRKVIGKQKRLKGTLKRKIIGEKRRLREILRRKMESETKLIEERMLDGNFGVDMLRILPLLVNLDGVEKGKTTRLILSGARLIRDLSEVCFDEDSIEDIKEYYLNKKATLESKSEKTKSINSQLIATLSSLFGKPQSEIESAWILASRFIPKLPQDVTSVSPKLISSFPLHETGIDIKLSSIGHIFLLSLGIDAGEHNPKKWKKIKFEALRQMALFLKILFSRPFYEAEIKKAEQHPIKEALKGYFQDYDDEDDELSGIYTLPETLGYQPKIYVEYKKEDEKEGEKGKDRRPILLDVKPGKSLTSFIRKAFQINPKEIHDLVSVGIVLPGIIDQSLTEENKEEVIEDFIARIARIEEIKRGFESYCKEQFPSYEFNVKTSKTTYKNFLNFISGKQITNEGKRTGSIASRIIRQKIYIEAKHEDGEEFIAEITFYPFESLTNLTNGKLMGWAEKVADDPSYKLRRMFNALQLGNLVIGMCSLHELLFPPTIYPELAGESRIKKRL